MQKITFEERGANPLMRQGEGVGKAVVPRVCGRTVAVTYALCVLRGSRRRDTLTGGLAAAATAQGGGSVVCIDNNTPHLAFRSVDHVTATANK